MKAVTLSGIVLLFALGILNLSGFSFAATAQGSHEAFTRVVENAIHGELSKQPETEAAEGHFAAIKSHQAELSELDVK